MCERRAAMAGAARPGPELAGAGGDGVMPREGEDDAPKQKPDQQQQAGEAGEGEEEEWRRIEEELMAGLSAASHDDSSVASSRGQPPSLPSLGLCCVHGFDMCVIE